MVGIPFGVAEVWSFIKLYLLCATDSYQYYQYEYLYCVSYTDIPVGMSRTKNDVWHSHRQLKSSKSMVAAPEEREREKDRDR